MTETDIETTPASSGENRPVVIVCRDCNATAPAPPHDGCSWELLWIEGWRWIGMRGQSLKFMPDCFEYSCPRCPSVLPPPRRSGPVPLKRLERES